MANPVNQIAGTIIRATTYKGMRKLGMGGSIALAIGAIIVEVATKH